MPAAQIPIDEEDRLKALYRYNILDTGPEEVFDDIVKVASHICGTPIALISLVAPDRQWFKAKVGLEADETNRDIAFCAHAILGDETLEVPNAAQDERFADNPLVTGEANIRFYAGAPLITSEGYKLGTLCAIDSKPHQLDDDQRKALEALARQVRTNLDLRLRTERLSQLNEEKNRFFSILAHDLRSPVKGLIGLANYLRDFAENLSEEERKANFNRVSDTAEQVDKLINNLLSWARFDRGEMEFKPDTILVKKTVENVESLLAEFAKQKKIVLSINCPDDLEVCGDPTMFHSIIQNLVSNGLKFTKEQGSVIVTCSSYTDKVFIEVEDSGQGLSEIALSKIFSVGTCFSTEGTAGEKGSGLGLPLCKGFAEKMGGSLELVSKKGVGTTARVILPASKPYS